MRVVLTLPEMLLANTVAGLRHTDNIKRGAKPRYGAPEGYEADGLNLLGCRGELAVAKALGVFWSGNVGDYSATDVGGYEVRAFDQPYKRLIIHPADIEAKGDLPFVSVLFDRATGRHAELRGWIFARDADRQDWWQDPSGKGRPAFFVPNSALRPMADLPPHTWPMPAQAREAAE